MGISIICNIKNKSICSAYRLQNKTKQKRKASPVRLNCNFLHTYDFHPQ